MNNLTQKIKRLNEIYHSMKRNYTILKKMFHNHSTIKQKFLISEEILMQGYMLITEKIEETETKRNFNKIIKGIKHDKNK
jgi:hypothetical protein